MKIKGIFLSLLLTVAAITPSGALDRWLAREDGGQPGAFLRYGAGARAFGMGKTFVGVADDASTVYWNPAGLGQIARREVTALYATLYEETNYSFIGYAHPLAGSGTIGAAVISLDSKGFQLRDAFNDEMGEGSLSEMAGIVSFGKALIVKDDQERLSAGASIKVVRQVVDSYSAMGYGADMGVLGRIGDHMTLGMSVQNIIAPKLKLSQATDEYPLSVTLGMGYRLLDNRLMLALDVNKTMYREYTLHVGGEYTLMEMLSFRAGIDETELSCGIGFTYKGYSLDYAFAFHDAWQGHDGLGESHRIGLTKRF